MKNILYALLVLLGFGALIWGIGALYLYLFHSGYSIFHIIWMTIQFLFYLYITQWIHVVIHETGHLVFGLLSGYRFLSFRIMSFMWIRKDYHLCLKRYRLNGTGGQCLMAPPDFQNNHMPFVLYQLGGCLMNIIFAMIGCAIAIFSSSFNLFLLAFIIMGVLTALVNGVPMQIEDVDNDGYFIRTLIKFPETQKDLWLNLKEKEMSVQNIRLKDMPDVWFENINTENLEHSIRVSSVVLYYQRLMDQHDFQTAYTIIKQLLNDNVAITNIQRNLLLCDAFYCQMVFHQLDQAIAYYQSLDNDFQKRIQTFLVGLRTVYIYTKIIEKNGEATKFRQKLQSYKANYPYPIEIEMHEDLMDFIEYDVYG